MKEKKKKPFYKKWWVWAIIILLVIGFINQPSEEEKTEIKAQQEADAKLKAEEKKKDKEEKEKAELAAKKEAVEKEEIEKKKMLEKEQTEENEKKKEITKEETDKVIADSKEADKQIAEESAEIGKTTIAALESNDFYAFVEEYKKLGSEKTPVWDNHLYGKEVTWTGTVVRAGTSQLFVYGGHDYNGESWDELGDDNQLFYSFVAKYADGTAEEFKKLQTGDKVTVEGDLESRGDFDLGFNWKIYNARLK